MRVTSDDSAPSHRPAVPLPYSPRTSWNLPAAALAAFILVLGSLAAASAVAPPGGGGPRHAASALPLLVFEGLVAVGTLALARLFDRSPAGVLALRVPANVVYAIGGGLLAIALFSAVFASVAFTFDRTAFLRDLGIARQLVSAPDWPLALVAVTIGAPLSEELLFRGFLFSAAAKRLGIAAAVLLTDTAWTALHVGYSIWGLVEVFAVGLMLSWLLVRTGSLWVPIAIHGIYNAAVVLAVMSLPAPA